MGHINFGKKQGQDKKGLISFEERAAKGKGYLWKIYKF
jgi:hypothetical protein